MKTPKRLGWAVAAAALAVPLLAPSAAAAPATTVVISEVYGGGGNSGARYTNDFVELYNPTTAAIDLTGYQVTYYSAAGNPGATLGLTGSIEPSSYYLIQLAAGTGGTEPLPTPDAVGTAAMSATNGSVELTNGTDRVDLVGYGAATLYEGAATPALTNTTSAQRTDPTTDSNNNAADFTVGNPTPSSSGGTDPEPEPTGHLVISEIYGGGGERLDSAYANDFVELYNPTEADIDLSGYTLHQWGTNDVAGSMIAALSGTIPADGYYLVQLGAGREGTGAPLPTADAAGTANIGSANGRISLFLQAERIDTVAYGTGGWPEGAAAPTPSTTTSVQRDALGTDTDNNAADFAVATPTPTNAAGETSTPTPEFLTPTLEIVTATAVVGQPGNIVVRVTDPDGAPVTSGTVRVVLDGWLTTYGTEVDETGTATWVTTPYGLAEQGYGDEILPVGEYPIEIRYSGTDGFDPATIQGVYTVTEPPLIEVTPVAPEFADVNGWKHDRVVIGETEGVSYLLNGEPVLPGTHAVDKAATVTVTAVAAEGYVFSPDATAEWTYAFRNNNGLGYGAF